MLGFDLYNSFFDGSLPQTLVPLPSAIERSDKKTYCRGGHGVLVVGYKSAEKQFICRNSWGAQLQDRGYFYMPADYVLDPDLVGAIWTIERVLSARF